MTLDAPRAATWNWTETLRKASARAPCCTLDHTVTPMGKRLIHQWVSQPLLDVERSSAPERRGYFFDDGMKRAELRAALKPLADLERLVNRVIAGQAQPRDLVAMRETLCTPAGDPGSGRGRKSRRPAAQMER
jgi:DNA mismatch repair protein MutS